MVNDHSVTIMVVMVVLGSYGDDCEGGSDDAGQENSCRDIPNTIFFKGQP